MRFARTTGFLTGLLDILLPGLQNVFLLGLRDVFLPGLPDVFLPGLLNGFLPGLLDVPSGLLNGFIPGLQDVFLLNGFLPGLLDGLHPAVALGLRVDAQVILALAFAPEEDGEAVLQHTNTGRQQCCNTRTHDVSSAVTHEHMTSVVL